MNPNIKKTLPTFSIDKHHAFLLVGESALSILTENGIDRARYGEDYTEVVRDSFTIADARALIEYAHLAPSTHPYHILVVRANRVLREAGHALLKILEEPPTCAKIFLILPERDVLIDTVLSRLHSISSKTSEFVLYKAEAVEFLFASVRERLQFVEKLLKEEQDARAFVDALQDALREQFHQNPHNEHTRYALEELITARGYLSDTAPSKKQILEYLASII